MSSTLVAKSRTPLEESVLALIPTLSAHWRDVAGERTAADEKALDLVVRAGLADSHNRLRLTMDTLPGVLELIVFVRGDYRNEHLHRVIFESLPPEWLDSEGKTRNRLRIDLSGYIRARLNADGELAQRDIQQGQADCVLDFVFKRSIFAGRRCDAKVSLESRDFEMPSQPQARAGSVAVAQASASIGDIVIQNQIDLGDLFSRMLDSCQPQAGHEAATKPAHTPDDPPKTDKSPLPSHDNSGAEFEQMLREYIARRQAEYDRLASAVLAGEHDAVKRFRTLFGPTAIARNWIKNAKADANDLPRIKAAIQKRNTYARLIKPVFSKQRPKGWCPPDANDGFDPCITRLFKERPEA